MTSPAIAQPETSSPFNRIYALALRHIYLHLGSWPRILEMMYWPLINMCMWGFTSFYITRKLNHTDQISQTLVAGVVLTEVYIRPTVTTLMLFLEEQWSRNLGHLFASPLRVYEYAVGLVAVALIRSGIALIPVFLVAHYGFGYSMLNLGWALAVFLPLLALSGSCTGLIIISLLLRFGMAAEWLAWMATWSLIPFFGPYYPISVLPKILQYIAVILPPMHVFASMQSIIAGGDPQIEHLFLGSALLLLYGILAASLFALSYRSAKKRGGLLQSGE